jgi:hypothetical protein
MKLRTVGDFLGLVGQRVVLSMTDGEELEATVRDLNDTATAVLLDDVLRLEHSRRPHDEVITVSPSDLVDLRDLGYRVGRRVRLRMRSGGSVEGALVEEHSPGHLVCLTMVVNYRPSAVRSVPVADVSMVEMVETPTSPPTVVRILIAHTGETLAAEDANEVLEHGWDGLISPDVKITSDPLTPKAWTSDEELPWAWTAWQAILKHRYGEQPFWETHKTRAYSGTITRTGQRFHAEFYYQS